MSRNNSQKSNSHFTPPIDSQALKEAMEQEYVCSFCSQPDVVEKTGRKAFKAKPDTQVNWDQRQQLALYVIPQTREMMDNNKPFVIVCIRCRRKVMNDILTDPDKADVKELLLKREFDGKDGKKVIRYNFGTLQKGIEIRLRRVAWLQYQKQVNRAEEKARNDIFASIGLTKNRRWELEQKMKKTKKAEVMA